MSDLPFDLKSVSADSLRRELERRQKGLDALVAKREKMAAELAELDVRIRELEGFEAPAPERPFSTRGGPAKLVLPRVKNSISLPDAITLAVETGSTVSPAEAAKLVLANGYQTKAAKFGMVVANALSKSKRFKRIGRGRYERVT